MKTAYITSNGCPENQMDTARVRDYLEYNDWHIVQDPTEADLILFNACGILNASTNRSLSIISELKEKAKSDSQLLVWGCLPKIDPQALATVYSGPSFGEAELNTLGEIIGADRPISDVVCNEIIARYLGKTSRWESIKYFLPDLVTRSYRELDMKVNLSREGDSSIYYIKTSTGCLDRCSYCAICLSRGKLRSKPIEQIMKEFRSGLNRGFGKFSLMGTDLGVQGMDLGYNLKDLLAEMVKEEGDFDISIRNTHPYYLKNMLKEIAPVFSGGKIRFLGIPAQSGSNRILKLMGRHHTSEDLKDCVSTIRGVAPNVLLRTQMMVGFPTETRRDFYDSIKLLDETRFDFAEVYIFSPRPGTVAADMDGQVSKTVSTMRYLYMVMQGQIGGKLRKTCG
ncbi:MAG: radical SAM protein [Chloroflexota bacterium]|nr:radical SAM protein [Chloroflexota bacterium]